MAVNEYRHVQPTFYIGAEVFYGQMDKYKTVATKIMQATIVSICINTDSVVYELSTQVTKPEGHVFNNKYSVRQWMMEQQGKWNGEFLDEIDKLS